MKKKSLIRKLTIASIVWLFLICAAVTGYLWLDGDIQSLVEQTQQKQAVYQMNKIELVTLENNIESAEIAHTKFIDFKKSEENNKDNFRRNFLIRKLSEISNELRAIKVSFTMTPFEKYNVIKSSEKVDVMYSRISLKYEALTDVTAFKILSLLAKKLNGAMYFKNFSIEKRGEIDSDVLLKISNGQIPSLVEGNIEFDWITIRLKDVPPEAAPAATPAATAPAGGQNV